jgi:hypothetical protein
MTGPPLTPEQREYERAHWKKKELKLQKYKYLCIGNDKVKAQWLHRWYQVPYDECLCVDSGAFMQGVPPSITDKLIRLEPRSDKNYDIKIIKTEHLLNGED